jgi:hypothetical protein
MSRLVLSFAALGLLLVPTKTFAGAWIKEHDCVGRDTFLKLTEDSPAEPGVESAGCTPVNAMVQPVIMPPGPPNAYGPEDIDDILFERFDHFGALEVLTPAHQFGGSNIWQSIPTIKEPGVLQPGFPASFDYYIGLKYIPMGDIEVTCSVCAMRPQGKGPQETVAVLGGVSDAPITCDDPVCAAVNLPDQYWRASASVDCSNRANQSAPPCGQALMSLKTPGLDRINPAIAPRRRSSSTTRAGCSPTTSSRSGSRCPRSPGSARAWTSRPARSPTCGAARTARDRPSPTTKNSVTLDPRLRNFSARTESTVARARFLPTLRTATVGPCIDRQFDHRYRPSGKDSPVTAPLGAPASIGALCELH